jgi:predicted nucleic acid-binding protein
VIVVSDTSPVCYLTLIGCLDLLPKLFGRITVPRAVLDELGHPAAPDAVRDLALAPPPWLEVHSVASQADAVSTNLHPGEREAIALAQELKADLILLDETAARQVAMGCGLTVAGLLGVLAEGAQRGLIDLPEAVTRLRQTTFRASPRLLKALLDRTIPP